MSRQTWQGQ